MNRKADFHYESKASISDNRVLEVLAAEGVIDGYSYAFVKRQYAGRDCWHIGTYEIDSSKGYSLVLRIDLTKWMHVIEQLQHIDPTKLVSITRRQYCSIRNVSPSLWNNGFYRCKYAEFTLDASDVSEENCIRSIMRDGIDWHDFSESGYKAIAAKKLHDMAEMLKLFANFGQPVKCNPDTIPF